MQIADEIVRKRSPKPLFPVLVSIQKRFSPRVFSAEPVSDNDIKIIFEAARWAPSGRNHQPWQFYWARKGTIYYEKISSCLPPRNTWATTSPILVVACYDPDEDGGVNKWAEYDLGAAVMSLVLQAQQQGLSCRQIGSFDTVKAKETLQIPGSLTPITIIAIGKMGKDEDYQKADPEIVKKELADNTRKEKIDTELF